jgi:hypothetical protein
LGVFGHQTGFRIPESRIERNDRMSTTAPELVAARVRASFPGLTMTDIAGCALVLDRIAEVTALDMGASHLYRSVTTTLEALEVFADAWEATS